MAVGDNPESGRLFFVCECLCCCLLLSRELLHPAHVAVISRNPSLITLPCLSAEDRPDSHVQGGQSVTHSSYWHFSYPCRSSSHFHGA